MTAIPPTRRPSRSRPARQRRALTQASSARTRPRRSSALSAWPHQTGPRRLPSPWPSSPTRSRLRIRSGHPAGERPVPAVVRRLVEHCLPELVVAVGARDPDVSRAAAAPGRLPGRLAQARRPAHLRPAGPQLVTERTGLRLVLEQRNGHLNDHAPASCHRSMIIVPRADDRCREPAKPQIPAGATAASLRPACIAGRTVDAQQDVFRRHARPVTVPPRLSSLGP